MNYLGDFAEDATVRILFTTHDKEGGAIDPSSAFEVDDFHIYKNSLDEKLTTNGLNISSPFTGLHVLLIDTSNDTGDAGYWAAGNEYFVVLQPDESVDGETVVKVVGSFSIERAGGALALASTIDGKVDTIDGKVDVVDGIVDAILVDTGTTLDGKIDVIDGIVDAILVDTGTTLDGKIDTIDGIVDAILIDTGTTLDNKVDVIDGEVGLINLTVGAIDAKVDVIDGIVDDILVDTDVTIPALIAALPAVADIIDEPVEGTITLRQALRIIIAYAAGKADGGGTATVHFRDQADSINRITLTVDSSGNRSAVTLNLA